MSKKKKSKRMAGDGGQWYLPRTQYKMPEGMGHGTSWECLLRFPMRSGGRGSVITCLIASVKPWVRVPVLKQANIEKPTVFRQLRGNAGSSTNSTGHWPK